MKTTIFDIVHGKSDTEKGRARIQETHKEGSQEEIQRKDT